jgi:hypothetical protein
MKLRRTYWMVAAGAVTVAIVGRSPQALASSYYAEYMTDYSGCDSPCRNNPTLNQTDDQINEFAGVLDAHGWSRWGLYGTGDSWAADIVEDQLGGDDFQQADNADIYAFSGHGGAGPDGSGNQDYASDRCWPGWSYSTCKFDANNAVWNETYGSYSTNSGHMRWAVMLTCDSVDTDPWNQWIETFYNGGTEYILGYRGLSADSFTTDEVAQDWANNSLVNATNFKSGWFSATSDWWVDDTAEVVAGGTSASDATYRRDNLNHTWSRRVNTVGWDWLYWAWQTG